MKTIKKHLITFIAISTFAFTQNLYSQNNDKEWDDYFMPGVGYKTYNPINSDSIGNFQGIVVDFLLYGRAKGQGSRKYGPSRVKVYVNFSIMENQEKTEKVFNYNFGTTFSLESKANRNYLIPYFGIELGGINHKDYGSFQVTPLLGTHLYYSKKICWGVQAGYQYTTKKFDIYSGYTLNSTINVLLW